MNNKQVKENISHNCKVIREREQLTQEAFARKVGSNRRAYSQIEYGNATNFETIIQIAALANISLDEMIKTKIKK